ncbi:IS3 family transposase [Enterococcus sp. 7E2_DIV0204]|uniref:IS3 family transposase n=1 Tax=Enterococcus sp. 7E2_DIV0204 TaxID=1834188 RepID=UPI00111E3AA6|nr:IS3 family transposase [Enterococcus sp. 7E2_DIV0204]
MQTKTSATRYSKKFRESMVSLSQTGRSANSLSKEYNVSVSTLSKWIRQADPNDRNILSLNERALLKENKRLKEEIDILKPSGGAFGKELINKGRATVLRVVRVNLEAKHRITRILSVLKIPRTTYYDYLNWHPSKRMIRRQQIKEKVLASWLSYPMYGYLRMTKYFNENLNYPVSRYLIYRLMRELGIHSRMIKKMKKPSTYTDVAKLPNLIRKMNDWSKVLLTDITYIRVKGKWVYLASLYNPETRRVIAHKVGAHMTKELATSVLEKVDLCRLGVKIVHSDMGSQYTSDLFNQTLQNRQIKHSYSRKGCPGDNARIESFHSILKREYVNFQSFQTLDEAIVGIDSYIRWYNSDRISLVA